MKMTFAVVVCLALVLFTGVADAKTVGIFGSNSKSDITTFLSGEGHTVVDLNAVGLTAANLAGIDSVLLLRSIGNTDLATWVTGGGTLITEWSASDWAVNTAGLLAGTAAFTGIVGTGTPITFTAAGLADPLSTGVSNPFSDSSRTEFFYTVTSGAGSSILATRPGGIGAILGGSSGSGQVYVLAYDWADSWSGSAPFTGDISTTDILLNAIEPSGGLAPIPEPSTWALFGIGLLSIGVVRRRRRKTA